MVAGHLDGGWPPRWWLATSMVAGHLDGGWPPREIRSWWLATSMVAGHLEKFDHGGQPPWWVPQHPRWIVLIGPPDCRSQVVSSSHVKMKYTTPGMRLSRCGIVYKKHSVKRLVLGEGGVGAFVETWRNGMPELDLAAKSWSMHIASNSNRMVVKMHDNCATEVSIPPDAYMTALDAEEVAMWLRTLARACSTARFDALPPCDASCAFASGSSSSTKSSPSSRSSASAAIGSAGSMTREDIVVLWAKSVRQVLECRPSLRSFLS